MAIKERQVAVVGGGISGLSAAWYLSQEVRAGGLPARVHVFEGAERFGGVMKTERVQGFLAEQGPDSFAVDKPAAYELIRALGLESDLVGIDPGYRKILLRHRDRLYPMPRDFHLMAPADPATLFQMRFLNLSGKLRMAGEMIVRPRTGHEDESVGSFMARRFGRQALERIGQPLIGSIYGCDIGQLSLKATFPRFLDLEGRYGSVLRGLREQARLRGGPSEPEGPMSRYGMFVTLRQGLGKWIEALRNQTKAEWHRGSRVRRLRKERGRSWLLELEDGRRFEPDLVCLALPAFQAAALFEDAHPSFGQSLGAQPSKSMFFVTAAFSRVDFPDFPKGAGFIGSADYLRKIQGCSFSSLKFQDRAPENQLLVRIFPGWQWGETLASMNNETIAAELCREFREFFKIKAREVWALTSRHEKAMPHYRVGHLEWLERVEREKQSFTDLFLTGNSYRGSSIPDCVAQSRAAAQSMAKRLRELQEIDAREDVRSPLAFQRPSASIPQWKEGKS